MHKCSSVGGNDRLLYSTTAMQGWRPGKYSLTAADETPLSNNQWILIYLSGMEDAHTAELSLDEGVENPNAFFAVYDGHCGTLQRFSILHSSFSYCNVGGSVAKFSGINVHKRLVTEEAYREKRYEEALKRAFLGTDEDLLARQFYIFLPVRFPTSEL